MSRTAALIAALRLGYIPDRTSSSSPVKYASGRRTVTSFIHVSPCFAPIMISADYLAISLIGFTFNKNKKSFRCPFKLNRLATIIFDYLFFSSLRPLIIVGVLMSMSCSLQVSKTVLLMFASISGNKFDD